MAHTLSRTHRALNLSVRRLDSLESRILMSITPTSATIPNVFAQAAAYDASGHLWVVNENGANGLELDDLDGTAAIDISNVAFNNGFVIQGGHAYLSDSLGGFGGIDDVNLTTGQVTFTQVTNDSNQMPLTLTATTNAIWFTTPGLFNGGTEQYTNYVGRWVPGSGSAQYLTTDNTVSDSSVTSISANGADSVWVGLSGIDDGVVSGANHLLSVSYAGTFSSTTVAVNSGNPIADANNQLSAVASDGSGGVWYDLSHTPAHDTIRTQLGAETLVHLSGGTQTRFDVTSDPNAILNVRDLAMGPGGRLWFDELNGAQAGYLNTATGTFDLVNYPAGTENPFGLAANPTAAEATVFTAPADLVNNGAPIVTLTVDTAVSFSGAANDLTAQEDTTFNNTLLATFTAPALPSGQNYTATIHWGDSTADTQVAATFIGSNTYAVVINGKSFATQGTYAGSISIAAPSTAPIGTLSFTSHIGDIPLNVTSLAVTPIVLRIVAATGTFTDDGDLATSTFTATINWGDGTHSTGLIVRDPTQAGRYIVIGVHQYSRRGTYAVRLTVTTTEANAAITNNTLLKNVTV